MVRGNYQQLLFLTRMGRTPNSGSTVLFAMSVLALVASHVAMVLPDHSVNA